MPALLDENPFFDEVSGLPLAGGMLYIGPQGGDPEVTQITIYSDRALTTPIANPQTLDANGRSPTKIWIPSTYSLQVNDSLGVQKLIDLDAGNPVAVGNSLVTSVSGTDVILGTAGVTSYVDGQVYIFKAVNINTGAVTLNIDSLGAKSIIMDDQQALQAGAFKANATIMVVYNSTNDNMRWINASRQFKRFYVGADIVSAASLTTGQDGTYFDVTGTTTITSIASRGIGTIIKLHFDASLTLTHNATDLVLPGGRNIITMAGDEAEFIEYASGDWRLLSYVDARIGEPTISNNVIADHKGLVIIRPTAATIDVDATQILVEDSLGEIIKLSSINLTADITASGVNGLDTGSEAGNTWYYIWVIYNRTTIASLLSVSSTAPTLPSGYTFQALVGAVRNDGSSDFIDFTQTNKKAVLDVQIEDIDNAAPGTSANLGTLTAPPNIIANFIANGLDTTNNSFTLVTEVAQADTAPISTLYTMRLTGSSTTGHIGINMALRLDGSSQFRYRASLTSVDFNFQTFGWTWE